MEISGILRKNPLFESIDDLNGVSELLKGVKTEYKKGENIIFTGSETDFIGIVLYGKVRILREDINGNVSILAESGAPEMFYEVFACAGISRSPVTVEAAEDCGIFKINFKRLLNACSHFPSLTGNLLKIVAGKNLVLNKKLEILSKRTIREKLLCFFDLERGDAKKFTVPFNREELADYLCADRSAVSRELSKMRKDGIIKFNKKRFEIL